MTEKQLFDALCLVLHCPRRASHLAPSGHATMNAGIPKLLELKYIDYASHKPSGYRVTPAGRRFLERASGAKG